MRWFSKLFNKPHINIGDTVYLGTYLQDGIIPAKVEWSVIHIEGNKALLISKYALITSGYCEIPLKSFRQLEWEGSLAREKCRSFFDECFSQRERVAICEKKIEMNGFGQDCLDYVFLLSEGEVKSYFSDAEKRKCKPTPKAKAAGARMGWTDDTREYTSWWILPECIRGGGIAKLYGSDEEYNGSIYPKAVFQMGEIQYHGRNACHKDFCIRPCVLVDIEKLQEII